jgi:hypothetical protein
MTRFEAIVAQARHDGLFVLPACADPAQKHPCVEWKDLQTRWPTENEVRQWKRDFPNRNALYLTGPSLGRFVVDPDTVEANEWLAKRMEYVDTQMLRASRGPHWHFAYPNFHVYNSASGIYPGIDIRGFGGVAVAAGSVHQTEHVYQWDEGCSPAEIELATAPNWLLEWLFEEARRKEHSDAEPVVAKPFTGRVSAWARTAIDAELERLAGAGNGRRNDTLARVSFKLGQLAAGGEADGAELRLALEAIANRWTDERRKSADTIARSFNEGVAHPRQRPVRNVVWLEEAVNVRP